MNYDNIAIRLLNVLNEGREISNGVKCKDAWSKLLNTKDNSELYYRLGIVMGMPNNLAQEVEDLFPTQKKSIDYIKRRLNAAFDAQNLNGQWNAFISQIDDHTIIYLEMLADLLETQNKNKLLNDDEVNKVLENLRTVCNEIISADINSELKKYLLRKIRSLISSIEEYQLTGLNSILDSLDSSIGHLVTNKDYRDFVQTTDLGKKVINVISLVSSVITIAIGTPEIGHSLNLLLEVK